MRFAFTEQQLELRATVASVLGRECTVGDLRAVAGPPADHVGPRATLRHPTRPRPGRSDERWAVLAELGATGLLVPEASGGVGLTEVELVGVLEEAGRVALPEPLAETAALAGPLLGSTVASTVGGVDISSSGPTCSSQDDDEVVTPRVPGTGRAEVLVLARTDDDGVWSFHALGAGDVAVQPTPGICPTRPLATVTWAPTPATLLVSGPEASAVAATLAARGAFCSAAQLLGLADRMISLAAAYATDRRQFGVPIGSFQAVKHLLANARVRLEFARPVVYRAAWSLATGDPEASHHCSMAKSLASEAADLSARAALQVHGAIGYTWECDLHFFMKRAWALSAEWGNAATHRSLVLRRALQLADGRR